LSKKLELDLSNPFLIFTAVWLAILFLVYLRLSIHLLEINQGTVILIVTNIFTCGVIYFFLSLRFPKLSTSQQAEIPSELLDCLRGFVKKILQIWFIGTIVNVIASGGLPIFWMISGNTDKDYRDYGVSTFNGLMNAFFMFSLSATFLEYCIRKKKKLLFKIIFLLIWQILLISRGALVWALLQMLGVYLVMHRISLSRLIKVTIACFLVIVLFGFIGDARMGESLYGNYMKNMVVDDYKELFEFLPSGFLWIYMYVTAGLNNVIGAIDTVTPSYVPYFSVAGLIPSVVRIFLYNPTQYQLDLVNESFNVSTFYAGYLSDFGIIGAIVGGVILQFFAVYYYISARRRQVWAILAYAVIFQALVLSVFWDTFAGLVTVVQICLAVYFKKLCKRDVMKKLQVLSGGAACFFY